MFNIGASLYSRMVLPNDYDGMADNQLEVMSAREDLKRDMMASPDFQRAAKRNGIPQGMLFTRGGEKHTYNVICMPGDELYAGDMIEVFGSHWIVMEARADDTTHVTGVMQQCNHLFRFQSFTPEIIERWGYIDISGYSSAFNSDFQLQRSEEQLAFYLPYDDETAKLFVDKRVPSHLGNDADGNPIMFTFKITGVNPVSESYNGGDHLLMVKAVRDLYSPDRDNIDLMLCDYIAPEAVYPPPPEPGAPLITQIEGGDTIRLRSSRSYTPKFYSISADDLDDSVVPHWGLRSEVPVNYSVDDNGVLTLILGDDEDLIGTTIYLTVTDLNGKYPASTKEVEVIGFG